VFLDGSLLVAGMVSNISFAKEEVKIFLIRPRGSWLKTGRSDR
jgi:hypothetical protein